MRVYRLQTDAGERRHRPAGLAGMGGAGRQRRWREHRTGGCLGAPFSTVGPSSSCRMGCSLRRARVMGLFRVELCGFTEGMVDRLKAMGLISEIITWKLRLFVPTSASGPARSSPG